MLKIFDTIFFNVFFFYKKKKSSMADEFATNYVSLIQVALLFLLASLANTFVDVFQHSGQFGKQVGIDAKYLTLPISVSILIFNHYHYKKKLRETNYRDRKVETISVPYFGLLMVLVPLTILVLAGFGFHYTDYLREILLN